MDLRNCRQATIQATKWLLSQQTEDGGIKPVEHGMSTFHKVPLALAIMGQGDRAARLCAWIAENSLDEEGDFTQFFPRSELHERFYPWTNAWLVCGAQRLGEFGLSVPALDFLLSLQHPTTGGFLTAGPVAGVNDIQDALSTAAAGLACLYGGQVAAAEAAGRFLLWLWENQPGGAAAHLYYTAQAGTEIVTEFDPDEADYFALQVGKPEQWYHVPGMAAGFLALLYEATRQPEYIDGTHGYLQFVESCGADRYTNDKSAFLGWGAALAYRATGNANYQRITEAVADGLIQDQLPNGTWLTGTMAMNITADVVDATAEGIIVVSQILQSLSLGD